VWHNPPLIFQRNVTDGGIDRGNSSQKAGQQNRSEQRKESRRENHCTR